MSWQNWKTKEGLACLLASTGGVVAIVWISRFSLGGPSVWFLSIGWIAMVLTAMGMWQASDATVLDSSQASTINDTVGKVRVDPSAKRYLQREKRTLLKAMKEIEFDRQMQKMGPQEAEALLQTLRKRAIVVMQALDISSKRSDVTPEEIVDAEVRARLAIAGISSRDWRKLGLEPQSLSSIVTPTTLRKPDTKASPKLQTANEVLAQESEATMKTEIDSEQDTIYEGDTIAEVDGTE